MHRTDNIENRITFEEVKPGDKAINVGSAEITIEPILWRINGPISYTEARALNYHIGARGSGSFWILQASIKDVLEAIKSRTYESLIAQDDIGKIDQDSETTTIAAKTFNALTIGTIRIVPIGKSLFSGGFIVSKPDGYQTLTFGDVPRLQDLVKADSKEGKESFALERFSTNTNLTRDFGFPQDYLPRGKLDNRTVNRAALFMVLAAAGSFARKNHTYYAILNPRMNQMIGNIVENVETLGNVTTIGLSPDFRTKKDPIVLENVDIVRIPGSAIIAALRDVIKVYNQTNLENFEQGKVNIAKVNIAKVKIAEILKSVSGIWGALPVSMKMFHTYKVKSNLKSSE